MKASNQRAYFILVAMGISLAACGGGTRVSEVRKDASYDPATMHQVFVVAVVKAERIQKMLEDEFVSQLQTRGRQAIASHTVVSRDKPLDRAAWVKLVTDNHCDTVIVSRLTSSKVENEKEVGAKINLPDAGSGYGYGYYTYAQAYSPGSYSRDETAFVETKVFEVASEREVWSAQSKTEIVWGRDAAIQVRQFVKTLFQAAKK
jgi:hypothetical protein